MSNSHSPDSNDSGSSFWSLANLGIGGALALFAGFWGIVLVGGGIQAAMKQREPKVEVAAPAAPAPAAVAAPTGATPAPAPAAGAPTGPLQELTLGPDPTNPFGFNKKSFSVKAGQGVKLTFANIGGAAPLPHNVVVGKASTRDVLLAAAMAMASDPNFMAKQCIPESPAVLAATKLVNAGASESITFTPDSPGEYPFVCSFPGHSIIMNGVIKAE